MEKISVGLLPMPYACKIELVDSIYKYRDGLDMHIILLLLRKALLALAKPQSNKLKFQASTAVFSFFTHLKFRGFNFHSTQPIRKNVDINL